MAMDPGSDKPERSTSNRLFGWHVDKHRFWLVFTLMLVFFTSPLAHLPYFMGYGELTCILVGLLAVALNVALPLVYARRVWLRRWNRYQERSK